MAHVVTGRCVDCKYTDCCAVCPSDSFFEIENPAMLVIDPNVCMDCGVCIPECPILAIYGPDDLPEEYKEWVQKNADLAPTGTAINTKKDPLPSAIDLDAIHAKETAQGWNISDPPH